MKMNIIAFSFMCVFSFYAPVESRLVSDPIKEKPSLGSSFAVTPPYRRTLNPVRSDQVILLLRNVIAFIASDFSEKWQPMPNLLPIVAGETDFKLGLIEYVRKCLDGGSADLQAELESVLMEIPDEHFSHFIKKMLASFLTISKKGFTHFPSLDKYFGEK